MSQKSSAEQMPVAVVVMGVSGCGKSTVGRALADAQGWPYAEGDDFHPRANVEKMAAGHPLDDDDRWPWLRSLRDWMERRAAAGQSVVVTCSALKRAYRDVLRQVEPACRVAFVELDLDEASLRDRMEHRAHFMPVALLQSQLATLEPLASDERGLTLDSAQSVPTLCQQIRDWLAR